VVSIELDKRLFPVLDETLCDCDNLEIVEGDALKLDLNALIAEKFAV
jgi:16S rRNA (adenine1518-N6/adenine1519-N6)-dimethyltransferase